MSVEWQEGKNEYAPCRPDARAANRAPDQNGTADSCDNRSKKTKFYERGGNIVSTRIKEILREKGMTVHRLHKLVGGNRAQFYQTVNGFCRATVPMRGRVSSVLGLPVDDLFGKDGMALKGN